MEPSKEQLEEWWRTTESVWQTTLALRGPQLLSGKTGFCIRGGRNGPFCLHVELHGAGLFGEMVIATSWGGYMHVECAVQSLRELETVSWVYSGPTFDSLAKDGKDTERIGTEGDMFEPPAAPDPFSIEVDESTTSGMRIEGAGLEEVLTRGTQAEMNALYSQFIGQPIIVVARETERSRMGRPVLRYFAWKVVE